jgi:hypothetical protein
MKRASKQCQNFNLERITCVVDEPVAQEGREGALPLHLSKRSLYLQVSLERKSKSGQDARSDCERKNRGWQYRENAL